MSVIGYGFRQGMKNIWKNRLFSLAAIGTISACLFLLGLFYALIGNFRNIVKNMESSVGMTVFFDEGITEERMEQIGEQIRNFDGVKKAEFISAQKAWQDFSREMYGGDSELVEAFGKENPLKDSASYEVYVDDVSVQKKLVPLMEQLDGVRKVNSADTVAKGLGRFNLLIAYISVSIIVLLFLVSVFLINTSVATGIRVRRSEISIMKYIGATDAFVRLPFVIEGIVIGVIGAVIPLVLLRILYERILAFILTHFSVLSEWLTFLSAGELFRVLIPVSFLAGAGIGFLGSSLSVRKYLRSIR